MKIKHNSGGILIRNRQQQILLDPSKSIKNFTELDMILVSHSHTDHTRGLRSINKKDLPVVLSEATYNILKAKGIHLEDPILIEAGEVITIAGLQVKALRSGHMLGSLQFVLSAPSFNKKVAYTGDLNCEDSLVLKGGETPEADVLLLDCTYGSPHYIFPKRKHLYPKIEEKLQRLLEMNTHSKIFLSGYPLGKAQELTKIASNVYQKVGVSKRIKEYNSILENFSEITLGGYEVNASEQLQVRGMRKSKRDEDIQVSFTGWTLRRSSTGIGFPLSGHSDFLELLNFVGNMEPEKVLTLYTFKRQFAEVIEREIGIDSSPL